MGDGMMNQSKKDDNPWRAMFLIGAVGTELAACVAGGYWLGSRVGRSLGKELAFSLIGVFIGMCMGGVGAYYLFRQVMGGSDGSL